ncbi:hypothetical protein ACFFTM_02110 [Pseudoduganella plicata]|uniref:Uncharacterized protein n=1 Tax=Pseudoduganella plicata TaxID=321984 RepID=A0AA88C662_9BURK|nr:hypothetical protein [Pseudoduganella plicata]GGY72612.1 hypothetical protein GCM10007388_00800 [Pseudoduganella plicata]
MTIVARVHALAQVSSAKVCHDVLQRFRVNCLFRTAGTGQARLHRLVLGYRTGQEQPP